MVLVVETLGQLVEALLRQKEIPSAPGLGGVTIAKIADRQQPPAACGYRIRKTS